MPLKSTPLNKAAIRRMIKESVDAERARHANAGNDARGSGRVRGQDSTPAVHECTFAGFMKCNHTAFHGTEGAVELQRWFEKTKSLETVNQMPWTEMKQLMTAEFCPIEEVHRMEHELWNLKVKEYDVVAYTQRFIELALMCPRMVEPEPVKLRMAHKLMEQKSQARDARITLVKLCRIAKSKEMREPWCHKCGKVGHKARYCKEKSVATGANAQPVWSCYDCGEQGHTRNRCSKRIMQEEVGEVRGRAYAIKDAEPQDLNVVT
ncbi:putative reverse transcriptase domain-containing protein, partial [Tanacetum coccineum]